MLNEYTVIGDIVEIICYEKNRGKKELPRRVLIDIGDLELVSSVPYTWTINKGNNTDYAITRVEGRTITMHNLIVNPSTGMVADHVKLGNGLDNRRCNLREVTKRKNAWNIPRKSSTGERCISLQSNGKYRVRVGVGSKSIKSVGTFETLEEAVVARDKFIDTLENPS